MYTSKTIELGQEVVFRTFRCVRWQFILTVNDGKRQYENIA